MPAKPKIQLAVSAIVEHQGRVLIVRRGLPPDAGSWAFPGGRVEPGETTRHAVLRELQEETGLLGEVQTVFDVYDVVSQTAQTAQTTLPFHFTLIVFRVGVADPTGAKAASDATGLSWIDPRDAATLTMPPSMYDAMARLEVE